MRMILRAGCALTGVLFLMSCGTNKEAGKAEAPAATAPKQWGKTAEGEPVSLFTLANAKGMQMTVTNYGARVVTLLAPDRAGKMADVVLGFDSLDDYLKTNPFFGAIAGRYGNRIGKAHFTLNGVEYKLAANNGPNSLHGGDKGFDKKVWTAKQDGPQRLELSYVSKDGEEGYPGTMTTKIVYSLTDDNAFRIDYTITTDKDTVKNVTNHSYFNLAGAGEGDILGHQVTLYASKFTPVDAGLIPTGELRPVDGTPFDFRQPHTIGERIDAPDEQIKLGKGYDHNFVLDGAMGSLHPVAKIVEPKSGRVLDVSTTEPGVQFYSGNFLDGTLTGKGGKVYKQRYGLCLETQHFPDSPNKPDFPTVVLKPGETYQSTTIYKFSTDGK